MACIMRIVWATRPTNADVSLVAAIFLNAGILLAYIINIFFAWRLVRSAAPKFGWNPIIRILNKILLWLILFMIVPLIVIIVLRVKNPTLAGVQTASTVLSRLANTYFLVVNVAAAALLIFAVTQSSFDNDHFGDGSWVAKCSILAVSIVLAMTEAGFRCGTAWAPAPLASDPAWWDSKAAFYCFNFLLDVLILTVLLRGRVDKRFHIPNKANGPGSYSRDHAVQVERKASGSEAMQ